MRCSTFPKASLGIVSEFNRACQPNTQQRRAVALLAGAAKQDYRSQERQYLQSSPFLAAVNGRCRLPWTPIRKSQSLTGFTLVDNCASLQLGIICSDSSFQSFGPVTLGTAYTKRQCLETVVPFTSPIVLQLARRRAFAVPEVIKTLQLCVREPTGVDTHDVDTTLKLKEDGSGMITVSVAKKHAFGLLRDVIAERSDTFCVFDTEENREEGVQQRHGVPQDQVIPAEESVSTETSRESAEDRAQPDEYCRAFEGQKDPQDRALKT